MVALVFVKIILLILIVILAFSLVKGKFLPWSSDPIIYKKSPAEFVLYVSVSAVVALMLLYAISLSFWGGRIF